jgi:uncharacterized protein YdbL (DUF1318 family)
MAESNTPNPEAEQRRPPEQIEREIEQTREELADTVGAVAEKADVKKQARLKVDETKAGARAKAEGIKDTAQAKTRELASKAQQSTPDSAASAGRQVLDTARENPVPVAIGGAFLAGFLLARSLGS